MLRLEFYTFFYKNDGDFDLGNTIIYSWTDKKYLHQVSPNLVQKPFDIWKLWWPLTCHCETEILEPSKEYFNIHNHQLGSKLSYIVKPMNRSVKTAFSTHQWATLKNSLFLWTSRCVVSEVGILNTEGHTLNSEEQAHTDGHLNTLWI